MWSLFCLPDSFRSPKKMSWELDICKFRRVFQLGWNHLYVPGSCEKCLGNDFWISLTYEWDIYQGYKPLLLTFDPLPTGTSKHQKRWGFPKIGVPQNGWSIMENLIKRDDLGVPYFRKHPDDLRGSWHYHLGIDSLDQELLFQIHGGGAGFCWDF